MVAALCVVSIERGHDPRDFTLMAYGGAGSLHTGSLARELGIERGLVPRYPSLFSAWGILAADIRHSYTHTINRITDELGTEQLNALLAELHDEGAAQLTRDRVDLRRSTSSPQSTCATPAKSTASTSPALYASSRKRCRR